MYILSTEFTEIALLFLKMTEEKFTENVFRGQSTELAVHFNARNAISDAKIDDLLNGANKKSRDFVQKL